MESREIFLRIKINFYSSYLFHSLVWRHMKRVILTYGTFDMFHIGHLNLLKRLRALGDELYVGVSTDEFNALKNKRTFIAFESRIKIVSELRCVTHAFPEENWDQKESDIQRFNAVIFGMGSDWAGKFDHLKPHCAVVYLDRTEGVSSAELKQSIAAFQQNKLKEVIEAAEYLKMLVDSLS